MDGQWQEEGQRPRHSEKSKYRHTADGKGNPISVHRLRAERALGRRLPAGAAVHHADFSKRVDAPLVICQDRNYHRLLHIRHRIKSAGGDPNLDKICRSCKKVKPRTEFNAKRATHDGLYPSCK